MLRNEEIKTLVEALPYLRDFKGKTVVVKYGGNAMLNDDIKTKVLQDIVFLQCAGLRPVVVHGGGPEITAMLGKAGKKTQFVSGLRVTDAESVGIAEITGPDCSTLIPCRHINGHCDIMFTHDISQACQRYITVHTIFN